jgi:hypothetical protein
MSKGRAFLDVFKKIFQKKNIEKAKAAEPPIGKEEKSSESDLTSLEESKIQENIRKARRKGMGAEETLPQGEMTEKVPEDKKGAVSKKQYKAKESPQPRIRKKRVRRIFFRAAIFIFLLFHVIIGAMYVILSPSFVEKQIIENFNKLSYGTLSLKVRKINPLTGILIEDILIKNGAEFDNSVFFKLKKLNVSYSLPAFLWLNIHIPEIGIYSPHVWLKQKNGVWNAARLMKPGPPKKEEKKEEKKKEEKKEEKKEPGKPLDKIELPLALRFLFNFVLDDVRAYVDSEGTKPSLKDKFNAGMEGFGVKVAIEIPPVKTIPLLPPTEIIAIFKKIHIQLNRDKPLKVWYSASDLDAKPPLYLHYLLYLDKKQSAFRSQMKVGIVKAPVRIQRKILTPINFIVAHDLQYDPKSDKLDLHYFKVTFKDKDWLNLQGKIEHVQTKPDLDIKMSQSAIVLDDLYPYFLKFTGKSAIHFGGTISLKPLVIVGKQDDLKVDGALNLYNIRAKAPGLKTIGISRFHLDYHTYLKGNPPAPQYFRIDNWFAYLNGATLKGKVHVNLYKNLPTGPMKVNFSLTNLRPERFVDAGAYGPVNLYLTVNSKQGLKDIMTSVNLDLNDFIYTLNDSRSRPLNLALGVDVYTALTNNMKNIDVDLQKITISMSNRKKNEALRVGINGAIALRQRSGGPLINGSIKLNEIYFHQKNLYDTFPARWRRPGRTAPKASGESGWRFSIQTGWADHHL